MTDVAVLTEYPATKPLPIALWMKDVWKSLKRRRSPDRILLTKTVFPALLKEGAFSPNAQVMWVGCQRYTSDYYSIIERRGAICTTVDIDPDALRWGRKGRHMVADFVSLDSVFPARTFDTVLFNGVFGWGIDSARQQESAVQVMAQLVRENGRVLLGWNTDRIEDPLNSPLLGSYFRADAPLGLASRIPVLGTTHVYDFLRRRED